MINTIKDYKKLQHIEVRGKKNIRVLVPCAQVLIVKRELVQANTYNPNSVPDEKLELLRQSIVDNGFCFPIVTIFDDELEKFVIVDGFHRFMVSGDKWLGLSHVPIVVLDHDVSKRMAATWQFNKARGVHQVDLDADLIRALIQQGLSDGEISEKLGIDLDTVMRYKQVTGIAELFRGAVYSTAWSMEDAIN
jgi:ParB-like chromosome segregation protein Spo0J